MNTQKQHNERRRQFLKTGATIGVGSVVTSVFGACDGSGPGPLTRDEQIALTATQAVAAIKSGRLTAVSYVATLLARAKQLQSLNTYITLNEAGALTAARAIDAMVNAGRKLPLLAGVPLIIKDNINSAGLPTTAGTPALEHFVPTANAPSLQALIDAGAIVLAKANMHELAFGITSTNFAPFAGFVKNPYNTACIPGGSSGGTASAIAARIAPAGLGTDTGGSCRVPAALTGTVGLRASVGNGGADRRYNSTGVVPISHTRDTVGPMGRTVADVALIDSALSGESVPQPASLRGLRLGTPATFWSGLDTRVAAVMALAKQKLANAGVIFVDVDVNGITALNDKVSFQIALHEPIVDIPAYLTAAGASGITLSSIAAQVASPDVQHAFGAVMEDAFGTQYPNAINLYRPELQALYRNYFQVNNVDAIFFPTAPLPATPIDADKGSSTVSINGGAPADEFGTFIRNTDPGSNAGLPGLSLPAGMTSDGLPVGMELDGPVGSDRKLLAIGLAMEAIFGSLPAPNL